MSVRCSKLSEPRWEEGAVEPVLAKRCTWEIPSLACRVLSRKPIKAEHMKSYSNLTTPTFPNLTMANSCPNDEWRERFKTRVEGEGVELLCNLNWNPVFAFDKTSVCAQVALQSGPAGGVCDAVEEGRQHHHRGRADHWQGEDKICLQYILQRKVEHIQSKTQTNTAGVPINSTLQC